MSTQGISKILFVMLILLNVYCVSAIRINEVMPHTNNSLGNEWLELFNPDSYNISATGWKIGDLSSNDTINFNMSANNFFIIVDSGIGCNNLSNCLSLTSIGSGLNDDAETVYLYDNNSLLVSTFSWNFSIKNAGKSWSFCSNSWIEAIPTPGYENNCTIALQNLTTNSTANSTGNSSTTQNLTTNQTSGINFSLSYDSEVYNNQEISVEINADNLEDKEYEVKIFLEYEGNTISEIYDKEAGDWASGVYYVSGLTGPGSNSTKFSLRLDKDNENFTGNAKIIGRLRKTGSSSYIEEEDTIDITERANDALSEEPIDIINTNQTQTDSIRLVPKGIKSYKSSQEYLKEYSLFGFTLFCIILLILLIKYKKIKRKKHGRRN